MDVYPETWRLLERFRGSAPRFVGLMLLAAICGCATDSQLPSVPASDPAESDASATLPLSAGHRRMLDELAQISRSAKEENLFLGEGRASQVRADLAALPEADIPKRWFLSLVLAGHELRLGRNEAALRLYEEAYELLAPARESVPQEYYLRQLREMAVAYLRLGESRNCVTRHTSDSCILPIRGSGIHLDPEGSSKAIAYFEEMLGMLDSGSEDYVRARWLLNIAYMTLGRYPDDVPSAYLIPPALFASDEEFPRFVNIAPRLGLDSFDLAGSVVAEDFDGDGLLDIMLSTADTSGQLRLFINDPTDGFVERTEAAGLTGLFGGLNLIQADYDNDGNTDVYVLRGAWWRQLGRHPNSLLRNNGNGTFTDVTFDAGLGDVSYPTQTAAWADFDNDGDLDLYVGNESGKAIRFDDAPPDDARAPCQLFRNNGDGTFTDVARDFGVENFEYAKGVVWGDYDNDRWPDLYVSNGGSFNRLYRNEQGQRFTDVAPDLGVTLPVASFPTWFWDVNNDGRLDLFVSSYGGSEVGPDVALVAASYLGADAGANADRLYIGNESGGFVDQASEWGLRRVTLPMGANFGDLDNDGFLDFYLGTGYPQYEGLMPNLMFHNRVGRGFSDVTVAGGFGHLQKGHGIAFADLDNDGDEDIYAQMGGMYLGDKMGNALFENPGFDRHWIKLSLVGVRSNRSAIGARIRVDVVDSGNRRSIYRWVNSGGTFGGNPLRREIGLGGAERIESLEIYWPTTDETQRFRIVGVDRWIEITEGEESYRELPLRRVAFGG